MATDVILPALGMAQDTGKIVQWLKAEGELVAKGEPLAVIETDKATVEIEAPAEGLLARIVYAAGTEVPVGQAIATILAAGEAAQERAVKMDGPRPSPDISRQQVAEIFPGAPVPSTNGASPQAETARRATIAASSLAARIADEHHVDLGLVKSAGRRIHKADVLAYLQNQAAPLPNHQILASPKARRLAREQGQDLGALKGSGPAGAVLAADVLAEATQTVLAPEIVTAASSDATVIPQAGEASSPALSTIWRIMAERTTQSWTSTPHFYLMREVNANRLIAWREHLLKRGGENITYTDLLVKAVATALHTQPRLNASWHAGQVVLHKEIHVGLAVAVEEGLVVPVIHQADKLGLRELARQRQELAAKARAGKLHPQDLRDGTFTISNLGMYGIDAFNAIINQPQAAILAVGRIAERVVPINGQPAVQAMMVLTLSCDHRVIDGARGAQFLGTIANLLEEPLGLLDGV
jgi:pyruvate dehydrogenase E2 component (dihydrolipoamide acetyltransferase)